MKTKPNVVSGQWQVTRAIGGFLLCVLCGEMSSSAQNYAVTLYSGLATNDPSLAFSPPANAPAQVVQLAGGNTNVSPPAILMTYSQLTNCIATNAAALAAFGASVSAAQATSAGQAQGNANTNVTLLQTAWNNATNDYAAFNSNVVPHLGLATNLVNDQIAISIMANLLNDMALVLNRLKPVLQPLYQGQ